MEYYNRCTVCGKIFCYTDEDLKENTRQQLAAGVAAFTSMASAAVGTRYDMYEMNKVANNASGRVVDYSKCPVCGSKSVVLVTKKFAMYASKTQNAYTAVDLVEEAKKYLGNRDFQNAFCFATMALIEEESYEAYLIKFLASYEVNDLAELKSQCIDYSSNEHFINLLKASNESQRKLLLSMSEESKKKKLINDAEAMLHKENSTDLTQKIDSMINELKNNKIETKEIIEQLLEKKYSIIYLEACSKLESDKEASIKDARELFKNIGDYRDSSEKIVICDKKINDKKKELNDRKKKLKKCLILICISIISILILCVLLNALVSSIKFSKAEKLIDKKDYQAAYNELIGMNASKKRTEYLEEIQNHGRYVIKNMTREDRNISYEYDKNGYPLKIMCESSYDGNVEYLFEYEWKNDIVEKMIITVKKSSRGSKSSEDKYEYMFYGKNLCYEFTLNTSDDSLKYATEGSYEDLNFVTVWNYIYFENIKSINYIYNSGDSNRIIEVRKNGYLKDSKISEIDDHTISYKQTPASSKKIITLDSHGLINKFGTEYEIERKYRDDLLIKKTKSTCRTNRTYNYKYNSYNNFNYKYDSHNNFIQIEEIYTKDDIIYSIDSTDSTDSISIAEFEWEWINY